MNDPCTTREGIKKKRWATKLAAFFVAEWDYMKYGGKRRIYHCPKCEGWHTTSSDRRDKLAS